MVQSTKKKLTELNVGYHVTVAVPKVDRGPLDVKNILGIIVDIRNGVHQIGTEVGALNRWFSRDELNVSNAHVTGTIAVPTDTISLREAASKISMFGGQGFKKCLCKPNKNQCRTKRCFCFRAAMKCNSRCHQSGPCCNK